MLLITGSSGYVGSSFIKKYNSKYKIKTFSLLDNSIESINFNDIECIVHCAALVHQKKEIDYSDYVKVNINYPVHLARLSKEKGVNHFIFMSTVAVYGENYDVLNEELICNPVTLYGKSKLHAELELLKLQSDDFHVSIIRPPMIYGFNAPGNIASLINLVKKTSLLPFGKVANKRSFIYIENLGHMLNEIIIQKQEGILLASDDEPISTTKLIKLIADNLEKKLYLINLPLFETFLCLVKPSLHKRLYESLEIDNSLTKKQLNLTNPYTVEEGIKLMIQGE